MTQIIKDDPEMVTYRLEDDGRFPNHPDWPLLLYQQVLISSDQPDPGQIEQLLESNAWGGCWRNGVFGYHHYHSNAHECLLVYGGRAEIQFGGDHGPVLQIKSGDVAVLPAGTAHKRIQSSPDFRVIGAYPGGMNYDMKYGDPEERPEADQNIQNVPLPETDPLYGTDGPLFSYWSS